MITYRERHKAAVKDLESAKKRAAVYDLQPGQIIFKNVDKKGSVRVGIKNMRSGENFKFISTKKVKETGVDINMLPDYKAFSEKKMKLDRQISDLIASAKAESKAQIDAIKKSILYPYYRVRRDLYDEYISSPEWASKRQECLSVHGSFCLDCREVEAEEIHHRHYETLGDECPKNDIVPLCRACHKKRHDHGSLMEKPASSRCLDVGAFVEHPIFGVGNVAGYKKSGAVVTVDFIDNGEKDLVLQFANLKAYNL